MGYYFALIFLVVAVPVIFFIAGRQVRSGGGVGSHSRNHGMTVSKPSSDQPTPRDDATARRLPPG